MILPLYRLLTSGLYGAIYPYARHCEKSNDRFWQGRLGRYDNSAENGVWIHAASAGETRVASYLAHYLKKKCPDLPLMATVQTRTGFELAPQVYPSGTAVSAFPLDSPRPVRRALETVRPKAIVITETEIWFTFLTEAFRRNIPVVLVNGRLSDTAFGRYRKIKGPMKKLLENYEHFFCKSETDAERYLALGAAQDRVMVIGDMKFDAPLPPRSQGRIAEIRARIGAGDTDFVLVAGSTRPGEELALLSSLKRLIETNARFKLVIAPRHIDRCREIREVASTGGIKCARYGEPEVATNCILVEEFGVLEEIYAAADLAFVGGTLVDIGGHNILEPVWNGTPVVFGPSTANIVEAAEYVISHRFGKMVNSSDELSEIAEKMMNGKSDFAIKTENSALDSPAAVAGRHILGLLDET